MSAELHGDKGPSVNGYVHFKCRCQECRDAWAAYNRAGRIQNHPSNQEKESNE